MAYAPHVLFTFRGTLGATAGSQDMWQTGIRCSANGGPGGSAPAIEDVQAVSNAFETLFSRIPFSTAVTYEECRGYHIDTLGRAIGPAQEHALATPLRGVTGTNLHPWSVAMVATFDAGGTRRGRFGRMYLPPVGIPVDAEGRIPQANCLDYATSVESFINAVETPTISTVQHRVVVASKVGGSLRNVNFVRVGNVLDTQRRRDNRLNEVFSEVAVSR